MCQTTNQVLTWVLTLHTIFLGSNQTFVDSAARLNLHHGRFRCIPAEGWNLCIAKKLFALVLTKTNAIISAAPVGAPAGNSTLRSILK